MEKYSIELTRDELVRVIQGLGLLMDEAQEDQDKEKRHNACVLRRQLLEVADGELNSLGVENALYTLYKVDEHLSILLTRKGSRNRQITLFISQRCIISIAKQICFVNTTYGSKT